MSTFASSFFLVLSILLLIGIFVSYIVYRCYVLFWLNKTPVLRRFPPKFSSDGIILGDGYLCESQFYKGTSNIIFVTLHGMGGDITEFQPFGIAAQKEKHSTLVWSQRNWGKNQSDSSYHVKTLIDDAHEVGKLVLKTYPQKRIVFVGHSLGAMSLGKLMNDYHDFPPETRFCLINFVTKRLLKVSNFSSINWFLVRQFLRGLYLNQSSILRLQPNVSADSLLNPSIRNVIEQDAKKVIPFYFMTNAFGLISRVVPGLTQNKKNKILLVFGGLDRLQNQNRIKKIGQKFYKTNTNISLILHPKMHHLFPSDTNKESHFYSSIIQFGAVDSVPVVDNSKVFTNKTQYTSNVKIDPLAKPTIVKK